MVESKASLMLPTLPNAPNWDSLHPSDFNPKTGMLLYVANQQVHLLQLQTDFGDFSFLASLQFAKFKKARCLTAKW